MSNRKLPIQLKWHISFQLICFILAAVLTFRGSGIELLVLEQFLPDHNPQSHWEKCRNGKCHCKLANICNKHCCCAFREAHPEIVNQEIEESRFFIRHSCHGHHRTLFTWQALPHFIFPSIKNHIKKPRTEVVWLKVDRQRFDSRAIEPPEKIPRHALISSFS